MVCPISHCKSIIPAIVFYGTIGITMAIIAYTTYKKSVESRKYFKCTSCGETFRTEHMTAKSCKVCGATLEISDDKDVTDKTF